MTVVRYVVCTRFKVIGGGGPTKKNMLSLFLRKFCVLSNETKGAVNFQQQKELSMLEVLVSNPFE